MKFFRTLTPEVPGELLAAQVGTTARAAEPPAPEPWIPVPDCPAIWDAFTAIGNSNGVIDHTTAAQFVPPNAEEN